VNKSQLAAALTWASDPPAFAPPERVRAEIIMVAGEAEA
jgi:hypothetical protein